jgi:hypothetical protein
LPQFFGTAGGRGFGGGFGGGFGSAGGRSRPAQGEDEKYELKLDFLDAVFGARCAVGMWLVSGMGAGCVPGLVLARHCGSLTWWVVVIVSGMGLRVCTA